MGAWSWDEARVLTIVSTVLARRSLLLMLFVGRSSFVVNLEISEWRVFFRSMKWYVRLALVFISLVLGWFLRVVWEWETVGGHVVWEALVIISGGRDVCRCRGEDEGDFTAWTLLELSYSEKETESGEAGGRDGTEEEGVFLDSFVGCSGSSWTGVSVGSFSWEVWGVLDCSFCREGWDGSDWYCGWKGSGLSYCSLSFAVGVYVSGWFSWGLDIVGFSGR